MGSDPHADRSSSTIQRALRGESEQAVIAKTDRLAVLSIHKFDVLVDLGLDRLVTAQLEQQFVRTGRRYQQANQRYQSDNGSHHVLLIPVFGFPAVHVGP